MSAPRNGITAEIARALMLRHPSRSWQECLSDASAVVITLVAQGWGPLPMTGQDDTTATAGGAR